MEIPTKANKKLGWSPGLHWKNYCRYDKTDKELTKR